MLTFNTFKRGTMALALAGGVAFAANAGATTVAKADTEDLAHIADLILVGEVQSVRMNAEPTSSSIASPTIRTHNSIKVIETLKGVAKPGDLVDVIDVGGIVDGHGFDLEGMAGYKVGERVLLFLQPKKGTSGWLTLGIFLGKYSMLPNANGGWSLAKLHWKLEERGQPFDLKKVPAEKFSAGTSNDYEVFSSKVKRVVAADKAAGIDGKWLPKYDHMGVGR